MSLFDTTILIAQPFVCPDDFALLSISHQNKHFNTHLLTHRYAVQFMQRNNHNVFNALSTHTTHFFIAEILRWLSVKLSNIFVQKRYHVYRTYHICGNRPSNKQSLKEFF